MPANLALIGATAWLIVAIPKGFFPDEDTGMIYAFTEASPDVSFMGMADLQQRAAAVLCLEIFGFDLSVIAIIGLIMLIGIVKKNAIMMIDFALERRRNENKPAEDAIYEAATLRFRPIMMTTMAAILGTMPIALAVGSGAELRQPLGVAVIGGLIVSQALTLFTIPVTYIYMDRLGEWLGGFARGRSPERATARAGGRPQADTASPTAPPGGDGATR